VLRLDFLIKMNLEHLHVFADANNRILQQILECDCTSSRAFISLFIGEQ
jgi:hypothetical protein